MICPLKSLPESHIREVEKPGLQSMSLTDAEIDENGVIFAGVLRGVSLEGNILEERAWSN